MYTQTTDLFLEFVQYDLNEPVWDICIWYNLMASKLRPGQGKVNFEQHVMRRAAIRHQMYQLLSFYIYKWKIHF